MDTNGTLNNYSRNNGSLLMVKENSADGHDCDKVFWGIIDDCEGGESGDTRTLVRQLQAGVILDTTPLLI